VAGSGAGGKGAATGSSHRSRAADPRRRRLFPILHQKL